MHKDESTQIVFDEYQIYLGTVSGSILRVTKEKQNEIHKFDIKSGINCMDLGRHQELYCGFKSGEIKLFLTETNSLEHIGKVSSPPVKILPYAFSDLLVCTPEGQLWHYERDKLKLTELDIKPKVKSIRGACMVPQNYSQIALGGDDQNLVIHDIYSNCNVFKARALHDSRNLDLEEHVSISGIEFLDVNTICTTTRQHAVRIYDPRTKRRPVMHNYVPNSISLSYTSVTSCDRPERVLVGTNRGLVQALELRNNLKAVKTSKTSIGAIVKVVGTTHPFAVVNCLNKYFHIIDTKTLETRFKKYCQIETTGMVVTHNKSSSVQFSSED